MTKVADVQIQGRSKFREKKNKTRQHNKIYLNQRVTIHASPLYPVSFFNLTKHMNLRHELFFSFCAANNLTNFKNKGEENNLYIIFLYLQK